MNTAHFDALLWLEVRRLGPLLLRYLLGTAAVLGLFALFDRATAENVVAIALGTSFGAVLMVPMTVSRDKLERTMEFLRGLPTTATEIAAARFAAAALSVLPSAILAGTAVALVDLPAPFAALPGRLIVGGTIALWLLLTIAAWALVASTASFELSTLMNWPLIALVLFALVLPRIAGGLLPSDPVASVRLFFAQPWAPALAATMLAGLSAGAGWAAFEIARRAIDRYRPAPERPL